MTDAQDGASLLTINVTADNTIVVVGDIDMAAGPTLDAAIREHESLTPLLIDLSGVSFIDSSGLRTLLSASRRAQQRNTTVHLIGVGPEVTRLLEITGTVLQFVIEIDNA